MVKYGSIIANIFLLLVVIFAVIMVSFSLTYDNRCEDGREFMQNSDSHKHTSTRHNWHDSNLGKLSASEHISKKYFIPALNRKSFKN